MNKSTRLENDSLGEIEVEADKYWGAQTERARINFLLGEQKFPIEMIRAIALIKKAAAMANRAQGHLAPDIADLIIQSANEVMDGKFDDHFPLMVWVSGSGTQLNMNVNEVIANRANELAGQPLGSKHPVHPNDHVNMSQSSNDVIPSAISVATACYINHVLLPAVQNLESSFKNKATEFENLIKIGRTHLQDAVPMTLGQELGGYANVIGDNEPRLKFALEGLCMLALGGTAIGTGLNAPTGFADHAIAELGRASQLPFKGAADRFAVMGSHDAMVLASGCLKTLAVSLHKIANDIRLLGSGPRSGLNELHLPANEPGSSIMPGKVNPTQCEAVAMISTQVMALDMANTMGGAGGHLEMNVYKPLLGLNLLTGSKLLASAMDSFRLHCIDGLEANEKKLQDGMARSLMLVTALAPHVGYDKAAKIAHHAWAHDLSLKDAAVQLGILEAHQYDNWVKPENMV